MRFRDWGRGSAAPSGRQHRFLIHELRRLADEHGQTTAVFTFPVHPRIVLQADYQPKLLNSFDEKLKRLATTEADCCTVPSIGFLLVVSKLST